MTSSLYPQRFSYVFLPNDSNSMEFPSAFDKHLNNSIPFKSTITTPNKSSWEVDVESIEDALYFNKGWKEFVEGNLLEFEDFLIFSYDGYKTFQVKIYGKNSCLKEFTVEDRESKEVNDMEIAQKLEHDKSADKGAIICRKLDDVAIPQKLEDGKSAGGKAVKFESEYPFFECAMRPGYFARDTVSIPGWFMQKYMSHLTSKKTAGTLVYADEQWSMKVIQVKLDGQILGGVLSFPVMNDTFKWDDICYFELVNSTDMVFRVSKKSLSE